MEATRTLAEYSTKLETKLNTNFTPSHCILLLAHSVDPQLAKIDVRQPASMGEVFYTSVRVVIVRDRQKFGKMGTPNLYQKLFSWA